jgi:hypothetical protein
VEDPANTLFKTPIQPRRVEQDAIRAEVALKNAKDLLSRKALLSRTTFIHHHPKYPGNADIHQMTTVAAKLFMVHHPISEPLPPSVNVREEEARSTPNESDTTLQYPELLIQPDVTSSTIYDHRSVGDTGMSLGIIDDNQLRPAQPGNPNTDPKLTGTEGPRELAVEGGILVRMDICSERSVSVDAPPGAKF